MIVLARLYSSLLTEERSQGEFCDLSDSDIQVGNPGWWALICIAPIPLGHRLLGKSMASGRKFYALNIY